MNFNKRTRPKCLDCIFHSFFLLLILSNAALAFDSAFVLLSVHNGKILREKDQDLLRNGYPPGSLIKVFTTIAFYQQYGNHFPVFQCPPTLASDRNGCWDRKGHGAVLITDALAYSCNVYFRRLSEKIEPEIFEQTLRKFQLMEGKRTFGEFDARKLMSGSTLEWTVSPLMVLRAYCSIFNGGHLYAMEGHASAPIVVDRTLIDLLRTGLRESSEKGTSMEARKISGELVLGKTGTSLLWHDGKVDWHGTQGWWIGLYPAQKPEIAILTFVKGGRGATDAAPLGGRVLSSFLQSK